MKPISFDDKWNLFKKLASYQLRKNGYNGDADFMAECLDYSFEEDYLHRDIGLWHQKIREDVAEFKKDCPEDFE